MRLVEFKGVALSKETVNNDCNEPEEVDVAYVGLEGKYYKFVENPSDGYRSYCETQELDTLPDGIVLNFEHQPVLVLMSDQPFHSSEYCDAPFEGIRIFSPRDKTMIGQYGTDRADDWYPTCIIYTDIEKINTDCIPNGTGGKVLYGK